MANSFYLSSRLRRYIYANQFGVESVPFQGAIRDLGKGIEQAGWTGHVKGTMVTDIFQLLIEQEEPEVIDGSDFPVMEAHGQGQSHFLDCDCSDSGDKVQNDLFRA